ncbi:hypothetical protein NCS57_00582600 [Fusarium keratoplasticum]|uniref:Uncharacterized protein n=1 Tax=Fusarium keratoplasticum TaxID=1328300 RepID=A0ACC0R1M6_9HYPO|nr:hypothetical protein NCS57_00582600 [Fusarium keratoplasticum]KAI8671087.1 hypothetical protein NCS57_00582600 [Fusarium keratoplasticum]
MGADDKQPSSKDKSVEDNLSGEEEEGYSSDEYSGVVEEAQMALVITPKKLTSVLSAGDAAKYVRRNKNEARKKGNEKEKGAEEPRVVTPSGKMAQNVERSIIAQRRKKKRQQLSNPKGKANEESETMNKGEGSGKKASS